MSEGAPAEFDVWGILALAPTDDTAAIRKAYARRLKAIDPETDPSAFIALRQARDFALFIAESDKEEVSDDTHGDPQTVVQYTKPLEGAALLDAQAAILSDAPDPRVREAEFAREQVEALALDIDFGAIERLRAMVFEGGAPPAEIAELTRGLLDDPAMLNIDHATRIENFIADTIVNGTPVSDPMIEPAIKFFRWDEQQRELGRAPIIDWILKRYSDGYFERGLPSISKIYGRLLDRLRRPPPETGGRLTAWQLGTRVEYLLAYLHTFHHTVLAGLNRTTLQWWDERIAAQRQTVPPLSWLREFWRRLIWLRGIESNRKNREWLILSLIIGFFAIVIIPAAMEPENPAASTSPWPNSAGNSPWPDPIAAIPSAPPPTAWPDTSTTAPAPPMVSNFQSEVDGVLAVATDQSVTLPQLIDTNPPLYDEIIDQWEKAKDRGSSTAELQQSIVDALKGNLDKALAGDNEVLISAYAAQYLAKLRWAKSISARDCTDFMRGKRVVPLPDRLVTEQRRLIGRAVLAGPPHPRKLPRGSFSIPGPIAGEAQQETELGDDAFKAALMGRGTDAARCNTQLALIDVAVRRGDAASMTLLRNIFGGR